MLWWDDDAWWVTNYKDPDYPHHVAKLVPKNAANWLDMDDTDVYVPWYSTTPTKLLWIGTPMHWHKRVDFARVKEAEKAAQMEADLRSELADVQAELDELKEANLRKESGERTKGGYLNKLVAVDVAYSHLGNWDRCKHLLKRFKETSEIYLKTYNSHKHKVERWGYDPDYDY